MIGLYPNCLIMIDEYVSIKVYGSSLAAINCGISQRSVLGQLSLLLYINDHNQAIKSLLYLSNSTKKLNKLFNANLKHLVDWLNANKISLNFTHSESVKYLHVKIDTNLSICVKLVSATFVLVYFLSLNKSTCQIRKNDFYFTSEALFVLEKIKF